MWCDQIDTFHESFVERWLFLYREKSLRTSSKCINQVDAFTYELHILTESDFKYVGVDVDVLRCWCCYWRENCDSKQTKNTQWHCQPINKTNKSDLNENRNICTADFTLQHFLDRQKFSWYQWN